MRMHQPDRIIHYLGSRRDRCQRHFSRKDSLSFKWPGAKQRLVCLLVHLCPGLRALFKKDASDHHHPSFGILRDHKWDPSINHDVTASYEAVFSLKWAFEKNRYLYYIFLCVF